MDTIELVPGNSLLTPTPEAGRQLAIKLSRLIIKVTQPDAAIREQIRPRYAEDAALLIAIGQTAATELPPLLPPTIIGGINHKATLLVS